MATINGTFNSLIAGTLSGTVATPGATGPAGPAGPTGPTGPAGAPGVGVPAGGTAGQFLTKIDGTNYNTDWTTVNLSAYAVKANNLSDLTNFATARDNLNLGTLNTPTFAGLTLQGSGANVGQYTPTSLTLTHATSGSFVIQPSSGITFPDTSVQTTAFVAGSGLPTGGTVGQVLTKNSGTNFDASFATLIPGDRYLTTSTTSLTINNANKTLTIGTGLSYTPTQNITISYDASNHMHGEVLTYNSGTGVLTVDVNHHTGSGTYTAWVVNVGGVTPATSVAWGAITGTISAQTDLQGQLDLKAPLASPALTGNVSIVSNSSGAALFIEQAGAGNILTLHDQATDTNFVTIDANGKVNTIASEATNGAGFNIAHGVAPTTPVNGDIWTTTSGLFARINAGTQQFAPLGSNNIFSNSSSTYGSSTATGTINVASGAAISGSTKTVNVGTSGVSGSTTNITVGPVLGASTTSIGGTTAASTLNLAAGATLTGTTKAVFMATGGVLGSTTNVIVGPLLGASTTWIGDTTAASALNLAAGATTTGLGKTVNIGTNGAAGSTTNIAIGSTTGTSTTTLQGATNGVTQTAGNSTTLLATTAFVTTADNLKANLASPTFTGTPTLPTGTIATTQTAGNNTTAVATTAFVTAAVPAIATVAQVYASTSGTTTTPPLLAPLAFNSGGYFPRMNFATTTSGAGASVGGADHRFEIIGPNVSTAGFAQIRSEHQQLWSAGTTFTILQFSKPVWFSFRMCNFSATYDGDAQTEIKAFIGNEVSGGVDPTSPAVGIYKAGGAGSFINLMVHDGTTLTKVATTTTFSTTVVDVTIYSNNGTVNLYLNGVLAATTTAGPTGTSNTNRVTAAVKATATAAVRQLLEIANIKVFAPQ